MTRLQWTNLALFLTFFLCYLEWGGGNSIFIWKMPYELVQNENIWSTITHPVILSGLLGVSGLLYGLFVRRPGRMGRWVNIAAVTLLTLVVLFFLLAGILAKNGWMIASDVPFLVCSGLFFGGVRGD